MYLVGRAAEGHLSQASSAPNLEQGSPAKDNSEACAGRTQQLSQVGPHKGLGALMQAPTSWLLSSYMRLSSK